MTLWQSRLGSEPAGVAAEFTESLHFDKRLYSDDLIASAAHVRGLGRAGILSPGEVDRLCEVLEAIRTEIGSGEFKFQTSDEDIHTAIERRATELSGELGAKIHTGRSRNDQVATALRMYIRRELLLIAQLVIDLQSAMVDICEALPDAYLPGYTHLQRAQPVLLAHHLGAHCWAFSRDLDRILAAVQRMNISPLGAGALAGSSLQLDPEGVAKDLGFRCRFQNSMDAVSDRDFVAEALFSLAMTGIHLSRMGEEIVLWTTEEFGFMGLDDAFSTGSSMLPQKKNPDIAELCRGKSGRLVGNLTGLLVTLKGLPLAYNRDLQEDKEAVFDSIDQIKLALPAMTGMLVTATFKTAAMENAADGESAAAVDLAEWLVDRGVPFRRAHSMVAEKVKESAERHVSFSELIEQDGEFGAAAAALLAPGIAVQRRTTPGGAGPLPVSKQIEELRSVLDADASRVAEWLGSIPETT